MTRFAARVLRFPASKPPRLSGPEIASYLAPDADIAEEERREALKEEADRAGTVAFGSVVLAWIAAWWLS